VNEKRSRLGKNEVSGLGKLYLHGGQGLKRDDLGLSNAEYAVFAKLAWFGLAKREQEQRWTITGDLVKASDVNESFYFGTV
jgi:hypothetical protein